MNVGERFFMVLLGLLLLAAGLLGLALGLNLVPSPGLGTEIMKLSGMAVVAMAGGGLVLVGLILLVLGLRSTAAPVSNSIMQTSELGEIHIAIIALENMVLRVVQQTQGVRDDGRRVHQTADGLVAQIKIKVMPDLELPGLVAGLQERTRDYLEKMTGLVVNEVKVRVENLILDQVPSKKTVRPN